MVFIVVASANCTTTNDLVKIERSVLLMGTMAQLTVEARQREDALQILEQMVSTIEGIELEISTWIDSSAFGQLNQQPVGVPMTLPTRSCIWLERVMHWWHESNGAFDPAIGSLIKAWGLRGIGRRPSMDEMDNILKHGGLNAISFDAQQCLIIRLSDVLIDAGAFGKGAAIDALYDLSHKELKSWMIDFGGQVAGRNSYRSILIAHPLLRHEPVIELDFDSGSLATSGGSERNLILGDSSVIGHILDPRSGMPVHWDGSVTVWSESALDADIISTALYVMGHQAGFDWAVEHQIAACFLTVDSNQDVIVRPTPVFENRFQVNTSTIIYSGSGGVKIRP